MYNTENHAIEIREYGRNIQKLVDYVKQLPTQPMRQAYMEQLVKIVMEMIPKTTQQTDEDYRLRIWSHLLQLANFELDVVPPGPLQTKQLLEAPEPVPYPRSRREMKNAQYGRHIQNLIQKAIDCPHDHIRQELINIICSYMKLAYNSWGRELATDEIIYEDLEVLSEGKIVLQAKTPPPPPNHPYKRPIKPQPNYNVKSNTGNAPIRSMNNAPRNYGTNQQQQSNALPPRKQYNKYKKK